MRGTVESMAAHTHSIDLLASFLTTPDFGSFTEIKFRFHFAPEIALKATIFAVLMGLFGGLLPAARAARLQIAEATKG